MKNLLILLLKTHTKYYGYAEGSGKDSREVASGIMSRTFVRKAVKRADQRMEGISDRY